MCSVLSTQLYCTTELGIVLCNVSLSGMCSQPIIVACMHASQYNGQYSVLTTGELNILNKGHNRVHLHPQS